LSFQIDGRFGQLILKIKIENQNIEGAKSIANIENEENKQVVCRQQLTNEKNKEL
jgi:hypothetical protein